jgi:hypothetical protein
MREINFLWNIQHANEYPYVDKHHHRKGKIPCELLKQASKVSNQNTSMTQILLEKRRCKHRPTSWACFFSFMLWKCIKDENK